MKGCDVAQAVCCQSLNVAVTSSIQHKSFWDLWWTTWCWDRFFFEYLGFSVSIILPMVHTHSLICIIQSLQLTGLLNTTFKEKLWRYQLIELAYNRASQQTFVTAVMNARLLQQKVFPEQPSNNVRFNAVTEVLLQYQIKCLKCGLTIYEHKWHNVKETWIFRRVTNLLLRQNHETHRQLPKVQLSTAGINFIASMSGI